MLPITSSSSLCEKKNYLAAWIGALILILAACSPGVGTAKNWVIPDIPLPLSQPGPYSAGRTDYKVVDQSRGGREIQVELWYPAAVKSQAGEITYQAAPDRSGAPYPLILTEHRSAGWIFEDHLVSHGFVMAVITVPDHANFEEWDTQMIDWPRDFLASLNQLASSPPAALKGLVNFNQVGVVGYSFGGDITLALSGARIDPAAYQAHCQKGAIHKAGDGYQQYTCKLANQWPRFSAAAGPALTNSTDGLWQPLTDSRIKAVMPMAASGTWLYGERGLAAASKPALLIAAVEDEFMPYMDEMVFQFENLGAPEKGLISFIGKSHMMVEQNEVTDRIKHFAAAFFGYHLQSRQNYQKFYSEAFVSGFPDLHWGVVR